MRGRFPLSFSSSVHSFVDHETVAGGSEDDAKADRRDDTIRRNVQSESPSPVGVDGVVAAGDGKCWGKRASGVDVLDAAGDATLSIRGETSGAREGSGTQTISEKFAASHKGVGAVEAGKTVLADGRRRRDEAGTATAGRAPEGRSGCHNQQKALHRTPRSASF